MHLQPEKIIENNRHGNVDSQAGNDQQQILQIQRNNPDEYQQDQYRQPRTEINFIQFLANILRGIIAGMHLVAGRQSQTYCFHFPHHFIAQLQLVSSLYGRDRHINGIQTIDTVIALGRFFHTRYSHQLVQADNLAVRSSHRDVRRNKLPADSIRYQDQTYPLLTTGRIHVVRSQKLFIIM